jgi:hypothetical protein
MRHEVRLCPTACPRRPEFPMVKPNQAGIIIRVSGVRVPPPALRQGPATSRAGLYRRGQPADWSRASNSRCCSSTGSWNVAGFSLCSTWRVILPRSSARGAARRLGRATRLWWGQLSACSRRSFARCVGDAGVELGDPRFRYVVASGLSGCVQEGPSEPHIWGGASAARGTRISIDERVPYISVCTQHAEARETRCDQASSPSGAAVITWSASIARSASRRPSGSRAATSPSRARTRSTFALDAPSARFSRMYTPGSSSIATSASARVRSR